MSTVEQETMTPAETLQLQYAAMRVQFTWMGVRKAVSDQHRDEAADEFGAQAKMLSLSKKLIDTKHEAYRACSKIKREITSEFKRVSLPYPETGIRLVPHKKMDDFDEFMQDAQGRLNQASSRLQDRYAELRDKARNDLGRLFNEDDYPDTIENLFAVQWNVENVNPPDYLLELKPGLYERELQRVRSMFNNAVEMAEEAFVSDMAKLVDGLHERLTDNEDGTPKVFGDGCVDKLKDFIGRFRELSVRSNDDLEKLVNECDQLTRGVTADTFRNIPELRQHVAQKLAEVKEAMESDLVVLPRRKIKRRK